MPPPHPAALQLCCCCCWRHGHVWVRTSNLQQRWQTHCWFMHREHRHSCLEPLAGPGPAPWSWRQRLCRCCSVRAAASTTEANLRGRLRNAATCLIPGETPYGEPGRTFLRAVEKWYLELKDIPGTAWLTLCFSMDLAHVPVRLPANHNTLSLCH